MTPEGRIVKAIRTYLAAKGIPNWRIHTVGVPDANARGGFRKNPQAGMADIVALVQETHTLKNLAGTPFSWCATIPYAIEVKSAKGRQTATQKAFQTEWERGGGIYLLCHDVQDVIDALEGKCEK